MQFKPKQKLRIFVCINATRVIINKADGVEQDGYNSGIAIWATSSLFKLS